MTDWIHCNKCYKQPVANGDKFNLTNCGHFVCQTCTTEKPEFCFQCEARCSTVTLSQNLDEEIRCYFTNIDEQYDNIHKLLKNMMFQKNHRQNLFLHISNENKRFKKELQNINYKYEAAKKYIKQIHEENKRLRDIIKNMGASKTPSNLGQNMRPTRNNNNSFNTAQTSITFASKNTITPSVSSNYFETPSTSDITFKALFPDSITRKR